MQCSFGDCSNDAVATYDWPWGSPGHTCEMHKAALQMTAKNLNRVDELKIEPLPDDQMPKPRDDGAPEVVTEKVDDVVSKVPLFREDVREAVKSVLELEAELHDRRRRVVEAELELERRKAKNLDTVRELQPVYELELHVIRRRELLQTKELELENARAKRLDLELQIERSRLSSETATFLAAREPDSTVDGDQEPRPSTETTSPDQG